MAADVAEAGVGVAGEDLAVVAAKELDAVVKGCFDHAAASTLPSSEYEEEEEEEEGGGGRRPPCAL